MNSEISELLNRECQQTERNSYLCSKDKLESLTFDIQSSKGYIWLLSMYAVDHHVDQKLELNYQFASVEDYFDFSLKVFISYSDSLPSISHMWSNAKLFEQEIFETFGVVFSREYSKLYFDEAVDYFPMRKNSQSEPVMKIDNTQYDLQLSLRNPFKKDKLIFNTMLSENKVSHCHVEAGLHHLGIEKSFEGLSIREAFYSIEKTFGSTGLNWSFLLARQIETAESISIPGRAQALRMVFLELNRIYEHFRFINTLSVELQAQSIYEESLLWINRVQGLMISYSGNEFLHHLIVPGGVLRDVSQIWLSRIIDEVELIEKSLTSTYMTIIRDESWRSTLSLSLGSKSFATKCSVTGPVARALGINIDHRKLHPFYFYSDVDFDIPVGTNATTYDLLVVKIEEIFQSFKIVLQVLDNLPTGTILNESHAEFSQMISGARDIDENVFRKSITSFNQFSNINGSQFIESHNGIVGLGVSQSGSDISRLSFCTPSIINKYLFENVARGKEVSAIAHLWCALDINMNEVER